MLLPDSSLWPRRSLRFEFGGHELEQVLDALVRLVLNGARLLVVLDQTSRLQFREVVMVKLDGERSSAVWFIAI